MLADFAKEIVAGRAEPRDLLTTGWVGATRPVEDDDEEGTPLLKDAW